MTGLLAHLRSDDCIHPSCPSLLQQLLPVAPCGPHDKGDAIAGIERAIVCIAGNQQGIRPTTSSPVADCDTTQFEQPCTRQNLIIHRLQQSMFQTAQCMPGHHVTAAACHHPRNAAEHVVHNTHNKGLAIHNVLQGTSEQPGACQNTLLRDCHTAHRLQTGAGCSQS